MARRFAQSVLAICLAAASMPLAPSEARAEPPAAAGRAVTFAVEKYTLANGLEVILHVDRRTPLVAVNVWYHVGWKDEPAGMQEFAHLFEHLFFEGSKYVGSRNHMPYLGEAGATERNGTTSRDRTSYYETLPRNKLPLALWLESDRMGFLLDRVNEKSLAKQRAVVKNEYRQKFEGRPYGLVDDLLQSALYPEGHPYRVPPPERLMADLDRATLRDVKAFYRRFYTPNNATLVVAGDIDVARTKALIAKYFGTLPRGARPGTSRVAAPVSLETEKRVDIEANVELAQLILMWPTPPHLAPGDGDLDVVAHILCGGRGSRLYRRLIHDLPLAQTVSARQVSGLLASQFQIVITLLKPTDVDKARAIVDEELERLRQAPVPTSELERVRAALTSDMYFDFEALGARANRFNEYNQRAGNPGYFASDLARYQNAAAADVQRAASSFLPSGKRVVGVVMPVPGAPRAGRLATKGAP